MPRFSCVLWDLDGTIVDSAPGITSTLAWTFEQLGMPVPTAAQMLVWVGPPLLDSFRELAGLPEDEARAALAVYRERYRTIGVFDATVYAGVDALLGELHAAGVPLSLATSKPESLARAILEHEGLLGELDVITGASEDERRSAKADVVALALQRLRERGFDVSAPVLVGDREHDIEGAAVHGVPTIFAAWGYGSLAESAGAIAIARDPAELRTLLGLVG
ncbi:HAD family hydrolase [Pseudolysinimonas kribbensis]|uniref:Haloacid dehalogenase n=1 Tax=Pseudolysinimonas kribbensis TaxID=433641 RepID=A0ABQ6K3B6_9MICO|nr:HAD hydrolase-like protein [Pseudolysinimonas kribbensis]GMA95111.1 haloacid dehalogenase [Pseudolysinimonas kribbensis]